LNLIKSATGRGSVSVRELGTPAMALLEPSVATKKATFGMS
jgi:hypothetical protein